MTHMASVLVKPVVQRGGAVSHRQTQYHHRDYRDGWPDADQAMPRTYAAWPRCWAQSSTMLTSRALAVTGGCHRVSTMRLSSSGVTDAMYSSVTLCTPW